VILPAVIPAASKEQFMKRTKNDRIDRNRTLTAGELRRVSGGGNGGGGSIDPIKRRVSAGDNGGGSGNNDPIK
jgi:hypothetical protein